MKVENIISLIAASIGAYFLLRSSRAFASGSGDTNAYVPVGPFDTFDTFKPFEPNVILPSAPQPLQPAYSPGSYVDPLELTTMPKGIRNQNPMNLRYVPSIQWNGQIGEDGTGYARFESVEMGIRAGVKNLINGYFNRGINSPANIIMKYSPAHENPTDSYIQFLANWMGIDKNTAITPTRANLIKLAKGIIRFENGSQPYMDATIERGVDLAMA